MKLDVSGHPLHTRSLSVSLAQREDPVLALEAAVIDLRKCGFVPVAGMLQPSGIIHHMTLAGRIDSATRVLSELSGQQPTKAFEPAPITGGECCFDPVPRLAQLGGETLDDGFVTRLGDVFGRDRGCSHLLTLAQLAASTVVTALDQEQAWPADRRQRRAGERVFHRAVEIDGLELDAGRQVQVSVQLSDLHFRPAAAIANPMDHFGEQRELRVLATVDMKKGIILKRIHAFDRERSYEDLESATWRDRSDELAPLIGQKMMSGLGRRLIDLLAGSPADRPFLDALLSLAPGFIQCIASLSERWPAEAKANPDLLGMKGRPDSCHMWRENGPLLQASKSNNRPSKAD